MHAIARRLRALLRRLIWLHMTCPWCREDLDTAPLLAKPHEVLDWHRPTCAVQHS